MTLDLPAVKVDFNPELGEDSEFNQFFYQAMDAHQRDDLKSALPLYEQAFALDPTHADLMHYYGLCLCGSERFEEGSKLVLDSILRKPYSLEYCSNLATLFAIEKLYEKSLYFCDKILKLYPDQSSILFLKAYNLLETKRSEEALIVLDENVECLKKEDFKFYYHLALIYYNLGDFEKARESIEQVLPLYPATLSLINLYAITMSSLGLFKENVTFLLRGLRLMPKESPIKFNLSLSLLALNKYWLGWKYYECRAGRIVQHGFAHKEWRGEDLTGKTLLVHWEQGFGDTVQFARFVTQVRDRFKTKISFCADKVLIPLFENFKGISLVSKEELEAMGRGKHFDYEVSIMSIPFCLNMRYDQIPPPHLEISSKALQKWEAQITSGSKFKIGICWAGNPNFGNDHLRSMCGQVMAPLLEIEDAAFYSFQIGEKSTELEGERLEVIAPHLRNFEDTAAALSRMDLVITVDTVIAHLAGGMNKKVWVLLPKNSDWRWGPDHDYSPWYPTARIIRQKTLFDWDAVIEDVKQDLIETIPIVF